jgi:hypothetical protein
LIPEPQRRHTHVLEFVHLRPEEVPHVTHRQEPSGLLDALDLAITPANLLAVGWTFARGEFDGLYVPRRARGKAWQ